MAIVTLSEVGITLILLDNEINNVQKEIMRWESRVREAEDRVKQARKRQKDLLHTVTQLAKVDNYAG